MRWGSEAPYGASLPFVILSASEGSRSPALEILRKHIPAQ